VLLKIKSFQIKETTMKMRFSFITLILLFSSLILAACGSASNTTGTPGQVPVATAEVSSEAKLAMGTLQLSGTEQDVTASQASELLTLWKAYQALSDSDTTAQLELDALVQQIQETMTSEQIQAIDDMQTTVASTGSFMQSPSSDASQSSASEQMAGAPEEVMMDGGTPPDGGMLGDPNMAGADFQIASEADNQNVSPMGTINPTMLNTLLEMLATKAQAGS